MKKCTYCTCGSKANYSLEEYKDFYEKIIPSHITEYMEVFKKTKFDQVYFGGGTPTIADVDVLQSIFNQIPGFKEIPNKCIEASPRQS